MNWTVVIVVAGVVGVLGTAAAILWWRLVNIKAPYRDARRDAAGHEDVVIIREDPKNP